MVFGLKAARVSEVEPGGRTGMSEAVARSGADLLLEHCRPRSVIAVSNGRAVAAVVHRVAERNWPGSTSVAMLGSVGESFNLEDGPDVCRSLALRLGGRYRSLAVCCRLLPVRIFQRLNIFFSVLPFHILFATHIHEENQRSLKFHPF